MSINNVQLKGQMVRHMNKCGEKRAPMGMKSKVWGLGARTNAWRITSRHIKKASTRREVVYAFLNRDLLSFGQRVAKVALAEVGVEESPRGSNRGKRVDEYQRVAGISASPWCASFVAWVYRQVQPDIELPSLRAWVPSWTAFAGGKTFRAVPFDEARAGDYVTLWQSKHIEIVISRSGDYLNCVGGNTSSLGQDNNGGAVCRTHRHRSEVSIIGRKR